MPDNYYVTVEVRLRVNGAHSEKDAAFKAQCALAAIEDPDSPEIVIKGCDVVSCTKET